MRGLGMAVDIMNDQGRPVRSEKGELVCTRPFPSMPVSFWNDPEGSRYRKSYFDRFPGIWCHGDYAELTEHDGIVIHGRSDAVLNPGGVRIGTAEIYRQVEQIPEVLESICVGQDWQDDVRVVLFVRLKERATLDRDLEDRIKRQIREHCTPRHVPARIVQVADIPRTLSGKITELAVRDVVHGRSREQHRGGNAEANPEALDLYRNLRWRRDRAARRCRTTDRARSPPPAARCTAGTARVARRAQDKGRRPAGLQWPGNRPRTVLEPTGNRACNPPPTRLAGEWGSD
jgi:acetoacetyl-CoA synthetase